MYKTRILHMDFPAKIYDDDDNGGKSDENKKKNKRNECVCMEFFIYI